MKGTIKKFIGALLIAIPISIGYFMIAIKIADQFNENTILRNLIFLFAYIAMFASLFCGVVLLMGDEL